MEFEQIDDFHQRAKVPGGWIVKAFENVAHRHPESGMIDGWDWRVAMCFVPDPGHAWSLNPPRPRCPHLAGDICMKDGECECYGTPPGE